MSSSVSLEYLNSVLPSGGDSGFSADGGVYITILNATGASSVRGSVVRASQTVDNAGELIAANGDEPIGIVLEDGIPNGSPMKVAVSGKAYCLIQDGIAATRGYWVGISGTTAGRVDFLVDPPSTVTHWEEVGHCLESVTAGTDKLALCVLHFN